MLRLFKSGNVLSMRQPEIRYGYDILVRDGRIAEIGRDLNVPGAEIVDCHNLFLLPGLIDAHVHIDTSEMCDLFIANGVTSVRHMSGTSRIMEYEKEIRTGKRIGPYIYSTSPIYDGNDEGRHSKIVTERDADNAIEDTITNGYLWIKTYPSIPRDTYRYLCQRAAANGLRLCGHMARELEAKELADLGYYCCEHVSSMPNHRADIVYMAKAGMWICPTHLVCTTLNDYVWGGKRLEDLPYYDYLPKRNKAYWQKQQAEQAAYYRARNLRPDFTYIYRPVQTFLEYSQNLMVGTDTMYPSLAAGFSMHDELEAMVKVYKLSPYQALHAATAAPARHMGLDMHKGILEVGMDADILLLRENPFADINAVRSVEAISQGDIFYDRRALDALLEGVRNLADEDLEVLDSDD